MSITCYYVEQYCNNQHVKTIRFLSKEKALEFIDRNSSDSTFFELFEATSKAIPIAMWNED